MTDTHRIRRLGVRSLLESIGQLLVLLGGLTLLFVGYQLWGTGIEESRSQHQLERAFYEPALTEPVPTASTHTTQNKSQIEHDTAPTPEALRPIAVSAGDPIAIIEIPELGVSKFVVAGVSASNLKKGPGHYPSTPQPGHLGNVAITGHRTTYGEPFRHLDDLEPGDDIIITDLRGRKFIYRVTGSQVVKPKDTWVVDTTDPTRAMLTLITCHPEFTSKRRLVITAELDTTHSTVVDDKPFRFASAPTPVKPPASTSPSGSAISEGTPLITSPGVFPVRTTPPTPSSPIATRIEPPIEAISEGWFADEMAWAHIFGWLVVLAGVLVGGKTMQRRWKHRPLAYVLTAPPFFVALYFVFQNLNRLSPPSF